MLHQVGVGALGPVFRTYEPTRDRLIAVKVFRLDITPEQAQALADELSRAADASLFHPSIVEPIAAGVQGTVAYRAEEYVAAESLDVAMRHYAPARLEKILPFITQLAGAIDFARAAGIGHGALHPRDVFVSPDEARIGGFGVVEALDRAGVRAPVRRPYTAPERIDGAAWGTPADVFSLAAITFELLTARRPAGTAGNIGTLSGADLGRHEEAVHGVLARAMDPDPARRYPSALAFAAALEGASRGLADVPGTAGVAAAAAAALSRSEPTTGPDPQEVTAAPLLRGPAEQPEPATAPAKPPAEPADPAPRVPTRTADVRKFVPPPVEERLVQPEGEEAFTESEPVEDVDTERDEDEAYHALLETERRERDALQAEKDRTLLDGDEFDAEEDEAAADRYVDVGHDDDLRLRGDDARADAGGEERARPNSERIRALPAGGRSPRDESVTYSAAELASATPAPRSSRHLDPEVRVPERREGTRMVPLALTLIVGLLMGFAAGYFVGERDRESAERTSPSSTTTAESAEQPGAGREWSEGTVPPPANPRGTQGSEPPPSAVPPVPTESAASPEAPPAPARPAAASRGTLTVQSTPARAGVTVNGRWRGRTPLTIDNLPFGRYTVRVVQPGFDVAREQVTLSSSQAARTLSFNLQRGARARAEAETPATTRDMNGVLFVDSRPRGAQVFVDDRLVGKTPVRVPDVKIGSHVVRLELPGHRRWSTSASVAAARETRVTGSLDPIQ